MSLKCYKDRMDDILRREVEEGGAPGVSALVLHKGREIYYGAFGMADVEEKREMKRDTIIRLFSMTKPITAVSVMILAQRGLLQLRDPIAYYLPEFWEQKVFKKEGEAVPVARQATILDMLSMTSGIPYPCDDHESGRLIGKLFGELIDRRVKGEKVTTQDYVREIAKVPLCFQPGEKWMYGLSADVLAAVVEKITGKRFGEFLKEEIFEPLEMKDTGFFVPEDKKERFAQIYLYDAKQGKVAPSLDCHLGVYYGEDVEYESGGAGLVSTLDDYSHFAMMLNQGGIYKGRRILASKVVEYMRKNALSEAQKADFSWESLAGYGYGCLMRTLTDPVAEGLCGNEGTCGWDGWTGNFVVMDPKEDTIVLFFVQRGDRDNLRTVRKLRMVTTANLDELDETVIVDK